MNLLWKSCFWLACLTITLLSLIPIDYLQADLINWWDKAQHFIAFFTLALLGLKAYSQQPWQKVIIGLLFYGAAIEISQHWLGWRFGEFSDMAANILGLVAGLLTYKFSTLMCKSN